MEYLKLLVELPTLLALFLVASLCVRWRRRRTGNTGLTIGAVALYLFATPYVGTRLLDSIELAAPASTATSGAETSAAAPQAIVVLAGDLAPDAEQPRRDDVGALTLVRLRRAAALHRQTGLPVVVSGGHLRQRTSTIAALMAQSLRDDFNIAPVWLEDRSTTTMENARFSAALLRDKGISAAYVVTDSWHLRRTLLAFESTGLRSLPVAASAIRPSHAWQALLPSGNGLLLSQLAIHEIIGFGWYRLSSKTAPADFQSD